MDTVSKKRFIIMASGVIVLCLLIMIGTSLYSSFSKYRATINEIKISDFDLKKVPDGVFTGSFDAGLVSADVRVTIKQQKITAVELVKHNNGKGKPAESIPQEIVKAQSLKVDIVSGATSSSKVILKAVENALIGATE